MELDESEARRRVASARVARLATVSGDGRPHLVPVTFALLGSAVVTAVDHKPKRTHDLRRLRNIAEDDRVALLADHYAEDWSRLWWVRLDGRATVLTAAADRAPGVGALVARYPQYRGHPPAGPVIHIEVRRWVGWAAGPG